MKFSYILYEIMFIVISVNATNNIENTTKRHCLEQLQNEYKNNASYVMELYELTAENMCFFKKQHVARCLDSSLMALALANGIDLKSNERPAIPLSLLENTLSYYIGATNSGNIFFDTIKQCAVDSDVIRIGDFTLKCECDFGSANKCALYDKLNTLFGCNNRQNKFY